MERSTSEEWPRVGACVGAPGETGEHNSSPNPPLISKNPDMFHDVAQIRRVNHRISLAQPGNLIQ